MACRFCEMAREQPGQSSGFVVADAYPVSPGHRLIVARRHVADWFDLSMAERIELMELVHSVHAAMAVSQKPGYDRIAGYNVGINVGKAAGQTVDHVHVHLIPRFKGDVPNPRGGVRWVIPGKADYTVRR